MKIAYIGEHHPTKGTYYRQRITVNQDEYNEINRKITELYNKIVEGARNNPTISSETMKVLCFTKPLDLADKIDNKVYLTISQLHLIWSFFPGNKRFTDNNTILMIK